MSQQATVNFRMDKALKEKMDQTCKDMGISMTNAFTMFAVKVTREQKIPFEITSGADAAPVYQTMDTEALKDSAKAFVKKEAQTCENIR